MYYNLCINSFICIVLIFWKKTSQVWKCIAIILALGRLGQGDLKKKHSQKSIEEVQETFALYNALLHQKEFFQYISQTFLREKNNKMHSLSLEKLANLKCQGYK
jgi:hypothetical protein